MECLIRVSLLIPWGFGTNDIPDSVETSSFMSTATVAQPRTHTELI